MDDIEQNLRKDLADGKFAEVSALIDDRSSDDSLSNEEKITWSSTLVELGFYTKAFKTLQGLLDIHEPAEFQYLCARIFHGEGLYDHAFEACRTALDQGFDAQKINDVRQCIERRIKYNNDTYHHPYELTIIYTYYNQDEALERLLTILDAYSEDLRKKLKFIFIDDGSLKPAHKVFLKTHPDINYSLYRIHDDIYCNMSGAKNLGGLIASTPRILFMDLDHYLCETDVHKLFDIELRNRFVHFGLDYKHPEDISHIGITLMYREDFFRSNMFDEDFAGNYGWEDIEFRNRNRRRFIEEAVIENIKLCLIDNACSQPKPEQRDLAPNKELMHDKVSKRACPTNFLRFNWQKVF